MHGTFSTVWPKTASLSPRPFPCLCWRPFTTAPLASPERKGAALSRPTDLARLLAELDAEADLPHRHLWLIHLLEWVRGDRDSVPGATARLQLFLDAVEARPELRARLQAWWAQLVDTVDITTLLADFGFAPRTAFCERAGGAPAHQVAAGHAGHDRCV